LLEQLHWLSVQQQIDYKTALLTLKAFQYTMPLYTYGLLSAYRSTLALGFWGQNRLALPTTLNRTVLASRAYPNYAPRIWNDIPQHLHDFVRISVARSAFDVTISHCDNDIIFNSRLKVVLFTQALDGPCRTISVKQPLL